MQGAALYLELITPSISRLDTTSISAPTRVRETVEPRLYSKLLVRLLALPIAALSILAIILGYGLQRVNQSADTVDRADVVVAHANNLIKLIVDEETALRGFLLVRNPALLQPMREADTQIKPEFDTLYDLVKRPDQVNRLHELQALYEQWRWKPERKSPILLKISLSWNRNSCIANSRWTACERRWMSFSAS